MVDLVRDLLLALNCCAELMILVHHGLRIVVGAELLLLA